MKTKQYEVTLLDKKETNLKIDAPFYTTDTSAYLEFTVLDEAFIPTSANITLINIDDKSVINEPMVITGKVASYLMRPEIIEHAGRWSIQIVFTENGLDYTAASVRLFVDGHLLDKKEPPIYIIEDVGVLINILETLKLTFETETNELIALTEANELARQTGFADLKTATEVELESIKTEIKRDLKETINNADLLINEKSTELDNLAVEKGFNLDNLYSFKDSELDELKRTKNESLTNLETEYETIVQASVSQEIVRENKEIQRVISESERKTNETFRISNENTRKINDFQREARISDVESQVALKANKAQVFFEPTLLSGYVGGSGGVENVKVIKDGMGFVHIFGRVEGSVLFGSGNPLFILPIDFRPFKVQSGGFVMSNNTSVGWRLARSDGEFLLQSRPSSWSILNIVYYAGN